MESKEQFDHTEVYRSQLSRYAYLGHALWRPSPEHTDGEVRIGDVGYFHEGTFKRLFNVLDDDPPAGCDRMTGYDKRWEDVTDPCLETGPLPSYTVKMTGGGGGAEVAVGPGSGGGGFEFESSSQEGAVLHLSSTARRTVLQPNQVFRNYILKYHRNWVAYAEHDRGLIVPRSGIVLVRGWVKTSSWAMAAFKSESRSANCAIRGGCNLAQAGAHWQVQERTNILYKFASGPRSAIENPQISLQNISAEDLAPRPDQCIFLCYYKIKYRLGLWPTAIAAAAGYDNLPDQPDNDHGPSAHGDDGDIEVETESVLPPEPYTPIDALLDYILRNSKAKVAVASEGDIAELFPDNEWPTDLKGYFDINEPLTTVDENGAGFLSLGDAVYHQQLRKRNMAQQLQDQDDVRDSSRIPALGSEIAVLPGGKTQLWLPLILTDADAEGVAINSFSISKDGTRIATSSDNYIIKLWDCRNGEPLPDFIGHEDAVLSLAFSPDGTKLVSGSSDCKAMIWDVETGQRIAELVDHTAWVWCVASSPDGKKIATGSFDQTACIWSPDGERIHTLDAHDAQITILQFSPDSKFLASCADSVVHIWDVQTGTLRSKLEGHTRTIWSMKFSSQSDRIVTGSDDQTSRIWDAETGDELVTLREHGGPVWAVDFSSDDRYVASGSYDGTIACCDSFSGENKFTIGERPARVNSLAYSRDGKYLVSGDADSLVKVWDASSGSFVAEYRGHKDKVKSVAWTPDDRSVVSSSEDGAVRVWSVSDLLRM